MIKLKLVLGTCFLLASGIVDAAPPKPAPKITGIFTDLQYSAEGGDMVGTEILLLHDGSGYRILLQCAEGRLMPPELLPAEVDYPLIKFEVSKDTVTACPIGEFNGIISERGLKGAVKGLDWPGFLPRKKSYWQ